MELDYDSKNKGVLRADFERLAGIVFSLGCSIAAGGVGFGQWSPAVGAGVIALLILFGVLYLVSRQSRRISEIYALAVVLAMVGLAAVFISDSPWFFVPGGLLGAAMWWAIKRIERKNWIYARK